MKQNGNKLIITRKNKQIFSSYFEQDELVQMNVENEEVESILGNIYLGKVKNIVKNIDAAFVEIENKQMCYLALAANESPIFANPKKNNKINVGDTVVVQVSKEDVKTKAPVATTNLNFTGKYVILTHGKQGIGISGKIKSEEERKRLKSLLQEYEGETYGWIVRTNAEGILASKKEEELLLNEIRVLKALYENVVRFGVQKSCFSRIYEAPAGFLCDIRNERAESLDEIVTDDETIWKQMQEYLNCYQPEDVKKLRFYEDTGYPLEKLYGIEDKLTKALQKNVWLKSGGTLVIEPTEALTVIDVNTGKAIKGNKKMQETFLKVNLEAAEEIAKQIRLRNLSGIIIVDFIDLDADEDRQVLLKRLESYLMRDPIKTVLVDITPLGLVEITRKKVRKPLHEQVKPNKKDKEKN